MDMKLVEKLGDMAQDVLRDIVNDGRFTSASLQQAKHAICIMKEAEEMKGGNPRGGGSYGGSYDGGGSYRRGRNMETGEYMSRDEGHSTRRSYDSYSGHSTNDRMIAILEEAAKNGRVDQREAMELLNRM